MRPATPGQADPPCAAGRAPSSQPADRFCVESHSRSATEELLRGLRDEGWGLTAWSHFLGRSTLRSVRQAIHRAPALAEATVLHTGLAVAAHPRHRRWVAASWLLTVTHLGMLENRRTLGPANVLTLIRANLPALEDHLGPLLPILALTTDFLDGWISRSTDTETPFGRYADFLADAALWNWYAARHEPSRSLRIAAFAAWALPIGAVATSSFAGSRMKDIPRLGLRVQIRHLNTWSDVTGTWTTPGYPFSGAAGNNASYIFTFDPVAGDGIRIVGTPGGASTFTSIGELTVHYAGNYSVEKSCTQSSLRFTQIRSPAIQQSSSRPWKQWMTKEDKTRFHESARSKPLSECS
ncbi:CDP-alcohol phosphatidyltransferase family protein [Arthrobacter bambusae]|uniref:CDP-alcohol phosphatidyltransferase family protein n=1 Tax=Arthrobacter bambusae TaxID=1338426 RepID=UPI00277DDB25|nr:CDP-alcohol phosphatidyltransferase family protein [Arthrobacter bambusae]MDQ0213097.1 hypothetical protein [Arthrobacter bambusae]MDQ0237453.1 hypothetical protein [Arthrobacter bambusae]